VNGGKNETALKKRKTIGGEGRGGRWEGMGDWREKQGGQLERRWVKTSAFINPKQRRSNGKEWAKGMASIWELRSQDNYFAWGREKSVKDGPGWGVQEEVGEIWE